MTHMLIYLDDGVAEMLPAYLKAATNIRMAVETGQFMLSPTTPQSCEFRLGHFSTFYSNGKFTQQDRNQSGQSEEFVCFSGIHPADGDIRRTALQAADRLVGLISSAQEQGRTFDTFGRAADPAQAIVDLHIAAAACAGLENIEIDIQVKNPFVHSPESGATIRNMDDEFTLRKDVCERFFQNIPPAILLTYDSVQTLKLETVNLSFEIDPTPSEVLRILSQLPLDEEELVLQAVGGQK